MLLILLLIVKGDEKVESFDNWYVALLIKGLKYREGKKMDGLNESVDVKTWGEHFLMSFEFH